MFRTDASRIDPYLILQNAFGQQIDCNDDGAGYPNARIVRILQPGAYRVIASDLGNNDFGNYRLILLGGSSAPVPVPVPAPPVSGTPIALWQTLNGFLGAGGTNLYTLNIAFGQVVSIEMFRSDASQLDPYLILQDSNGGQVAVDDDGAGFPNARIEMFLAPGSYRILCRDFGNNDGGNYRLGTIGAPLAINPGQCMQGFLPVNGLVAYTLLLYTPRTVTIEMFRLDNSRLDPYVILYDAAGRQLAADDDGAGYPNSRLSMYLASGTYIIIASDLGNNDSGNYQISVR
jgi:hypothetical protein